jgi:DNA-binding transcriptional MocR family regulator
MLGDGHWLVRGLVLRALTDHHGEKFTNVLETFSRSDGDAWVRRMAGVLLARQQAARAAVATQPAGPQSTAQPAATRPAAEAPRPVIALPEAGGQAQPRR